MLFFHRPTLYVRFFINRIEIRDLDTGRVIDRNSSTPFSSERLLLADFFTAECFLRELVKELYPTYFLSPPSFKMVIQPMEKKEGGLSQVELRAFADSGEQAGGVIVKLYQESNLLSDDEVRKIICSKEYN
jgi:hypothetical protein